MDRPATGGRVVLDRAASDADAVVFRALLQTPSGDWRAEARVVLADGQVTFGDWQGDRGPPPAWLVAHAHAFLRGEWRARRGPDPEPWPTRVNRWREERT